jgi:zinc D-Ala-D-Ala dipeptidase
MNNEQHTEEARRTYWSTQMDAAYRFMSQMQEYPVEECCESLVFLPEAVKDEGLVVNFSSTKLAGKYERLFYLRTALVEDFIAVSREMNDRGLILKVEDGFRSRAMQKSLALQESLFDKILQKVMWETRCEKPESKLMLQRLTALIATSPKTGTHMSGSAIDISVLSLDDLSEVDRGGSYLELSELTPMASSFISADAAQNRIEITEIMHRHGFKAYPYEFWHYSKGDAYTEFLSNSDTPARYGPVDFDPVSGTISPILNAKNPFHSLKDIEKNIELALNRLNTYPDTN